MKKKKKNCPKDFLHNSQTDIAYIFKIPPPPLEMKQIFLSTNSRAIHLI